MFSHLQRELEEKALAEAKAISEGKMIDDLTGKINTEWMLRFYRLILQYTMGSTDVKDPWQNHSNIFLLYIYSVIITSQGLLQKIENTYTNNNYIKELKKSGHLSEEELNHIINDIKRCRIRFEIYEGILKQIFGIPIKEMSWKKIGEKFPSFDFLSVSQQKSLIEKIIWPIFGVPTGKDTNIEGRWTNTYNPPLLAVNCQFDLKTATRTTCKLFSVPLFPYPSNIYPKTSGYSTPDCIYPLTLWNELAKNVKTSIDISRIQFSFLEKYFLYVFNMSYGDYYAVGKKGEEIVNWIDDTYKDAEQIAKNAAGVAAEVINEVAGMGRAIGNFATNPSAKSNFMGTAALFGVVGFAVYFISQEVLEK